MERMCVGYNMGRMRRLCHVCVCVCVFVFVCVCVCVCVCVLRWGGEGDDSGFQLFFLLARVVLGDAALFPARAKINPGVQRGGRNRPPLGMVL